MTTEGKGRLVAVAPGYIAVYSDLICPWAHLAVHRLHERRRALGLEDAVTFDPRAFPLELINEQSTPKKTLDAEIPVVGTLDPTAGWQIWQRDDAEYPVTSLPALEAVHAAKKQGPTVAEQLDRALRRAFFGSSVSVSMRHEILEVAAGVEGLDVDLLGDELDSGAARSALSRDHLAAETDAVQGSPHLFLADGTNAANPGIEMHWEGEHGEGFPVVDSDDPSVYDDLLRRAAEGGSDG